MTSLFNNNIEIKIPNKHRLINIRLTQDQYDTLMSELASLYGYHWNDDYIHADNCGSKIKYIIENQVE